MGGGRPRTKSNPRSNSGRSMTYVRRQCSTRFVPRWLLTRDRQPLGSSPNHAHATEDNTPCWGESAVATRVLTQLLHLGNYASTLPPTGEQRVREGASRPRITTRVVATRGCTSHHGVEPSGCTSHTGLPPLFEPSIATRGGVGTTITTRAGVATRGSHGIKTQLVTVVAGRLRVATRYFPPGFEPRGWHTNREGERAILVSHLAISRRDPKRLAPRSRLEEGADHSTLTLHNR